MFRIKKIKRVFHWKLRHNQSGNVILPALMIAGVIGVTIAAITKFSDQVLTTRQVEHNEEQASEVAQKALAMASYLVANNLILCKEEGWSGLSRKCKWGGSYQRTTISESLYKLSPVSSTADKLEYKIQIPVFASRDGSADGDIEASLTFDLVDWGSDKSSESILGIIPYEKSPVDDDRSIVLIKSSVAFGSQKITLSGGIRRPLGIPDIVVTQAPSACPAACLPGLSENPHQECRGPQQIPALATVEASYEVINRGPGVLYDLAFEKAMIHDPLFFGAKAKDMNTRTTLEGMPPTDEMIVPSRTRRPVSDTFACASPIFTRQVVSRRSLGRNTATVQQHQVPYAYASFELSPSNYDPLKKPTETIYKSNFSNPNWTKNPTQSRIEPKRVGNNLKINDAIDLSTQLTIQIIPTH